MDQRHRNGEPPRHEDDDRRMLYERPRIEESAAFETLALACLAGIFDCGDEPGTFAS